MAGSSSSNPAVPCTVSVNCGDAVVCTTMPKWWSLTVSGVVNGSCSTCSGFNGTFNLKYAPDASPCTWDTDEVGTCGGGPSARMWTLYYDSLDSQWVLTAGVGPAIYTIEGFLFNCTGPNVFTRDVTNGSCGGFPATLTLEPNYTSDPCASSSTSLGSVTSYSCSPCNTQTSCANDGILTAFKRQLYQGDFEIIGVGTRDSGQGSMTLTEVPADAHVVEAYLYWNTIGPSCVDATAVQLTVCGQASGSSLAPLPSASTSVVGVCIGTCGNTCWLQFADGTGNDGATTPQPIINRAYRANVGPTGNGIVTGNAVYCVSGLPFDANQPAASNPEQSHYPGCGGSQGVVLLVIWEWNTGQGPTDQTRYREVSIYDGAVLINNDTSSEIFGGVNTYSVDHNTAYFQGCKIGWGVGDAQGYPDHASFNDVVLNTGPSFFSPDQGNLLSAQTMEVTNGQTFNSFTVFDVETDTDCLAWFLYAQSGYGCTCRISADLISDGIGFVIQGPYALSLGCQNVNVVSVTDNCPCVPLEDGWQININGTGWVNVPLAGVLVQTGDLVDIRINPSNTCGLCTNSGPYCLPPN